MKSLRKRTALLCVIALLFSVLTPFEAGATETESVFFEARSYAEEALSPEYFPGEEETAGVTPSVPMVAIDLCDLTETVTEEAEVTETLVNPAEAETEIETAPEETGAAPEAETTGDETTAARTTVAETTTEMTAEITTEDDTAAVTEVVEVTEPAPETILPEETQEVTETTVETATTEEAAAEPETEPVITTEAEKTVPDTKPAKSPTKPPEPETAPAVKTETVKEAPETETEPEEKPFDIATVTDDEIRAEAERLFSFGELDAFVQSLSGAALSRYRNAVEPLKLIGRKTAKKGLLQAPVSPTSVWVDRFDETIDGGNGVTTHIYYVKDTEASTKKLSTKALCLNASNIGPNGMTMPYVKLTGTDEATIMLKAALIRAYTDDFEPEKKITDSSDPDYNDLVWFWYDGNESQDTIICKCHALVSYIYSGDVGGANGIEEISPSIMNNQIKPIISAIKVWYRHNTSGFKDILESYDVYVAKGDGMTRNGIPLQSIAWLEKAPKPTPPEPDTGFFQIQKTLDTKCKDIPFGSKAYPKKGIKFYVYTDADCTNRAKDVNGKYISLVTDADGLTPVCEVKEGTYYYREAKDSLAGTAWVWNSSKIKIIIEAASASGDDPLLLKFANQGNMNPIGVLLRKLDKKTGEDVRRVGR